MKPTEYYYVDTIKDEDGITLYYVMHQKENGNNQVTQQPFYTYREAEVLMHELNDDLLDNE